MIIRRSFFLIINFLVIAVLIGYVLYPSLASVWESLGGSFGKLTLRHYYSLLLSGGYLRAIFNTLFLSFSTVLGAGTFGILLSYIFWRFEFPLKSVLSKIFLLPLGLPPLVGVFSFLFLYSESGIVPRFLQQIFKLSSVPFSFDGFAAVLVIHIYSFFVHFFLFTSTALSRFDYSIIEASENLGANKVRTFFRVLLPVLRPSLYSASLIVFILSTASFTAPLLFASRERFLTVEIYNQKLNGSFEIASALTVVLVLLSVVLLYIFEKENSNKLLNVSRRGVSSTLPPMRLNPLFGILLALQFGFVILPIATLVLMSFSASDASPLSIIPDKYSFENYVGVFTQDRFYEPFMNSLSMSLLASVPNLVFGFFAGILITQKKVVAKPLISILLLLPLAIPGTALAINMIATFNKPSILGLGQVLVASSGILPLAYFIRNIPYTTRSVSSVLSSFDYSLVEAASNLGSPFVKVIGRVVLPIILSSIASGFLFTFISALSEFPCSVLLYNAENTPISVEIFSELRQNEFGVASAQGILLMLLIFAITWVSSFIFKSQNKLSSFEF